MTFRASANAAVAAGDAVGNDETLAALTDRQRVHRLMRRLRAEGIGARLGLSSREAQAVEWNDRWAYGRKDWERARWGHPYADGRLVEELVLWCDSAATAVLVEIRAQRMALAASAGRLDGSACVFLVGRPHESHAPPR